IRGVVRYYSPGHVALARFLVASALMAVSAVCRRMRLPAPRDVPSLLLVAFLGVFVYHVSLNFGLTKVTAGAASMIVNTTPVFTALLAAVFLGERLRAIGWAGSFVSLGGAALIGV